MLTIRKKQIDILSDYIRKGFEVTSIRDLKEKYPKETRQISDHDLLILIRIGIEKADMYNISEREDVFAFLKYMIFFGNDFDTNANTKWAGHILLKKNLTGTEKINQIRIFEFEKRKERGEFE